MKVLTRKCTYGNIVAVTTKAFCNEVKTMRLALITCAVHRCRNRCQLSGLADHNNTQVSELSSDRRQCTGWIQIVECTVEM